LVLLLADAGVLEDVLVDLVAEALQLHHAGPVVQGLLRRHRVLVPGVGRRRVRVRAVADEALARVVAARALALGRGRPGRVRLAGLAVRAGLAPALGVALRLTLLVGPLRLLRPGLGLVRALAALALGTRLALGVLGLARLRLRLAGFGLSGALVFGLAPGF